MRSTALDTAGHEDLEAIAIDAYKTFNLLVAGVAGYDSELDALRRELEHSARVASATDREIASRAEADPVPPWVIKMQADSLRELVDGLFELHTRAEKRRFGDSRKAFVRKVAKGHVVRDFIRSLRRVEHSSALVYCKMDNDAWYIAVEMRCKAEKEGWTEPSAIEEAVRQEVERRKEKERVAEEKRQKLEAEIRESARKGMESRDMKREHPKVTARQIGERPLAVQVGCKILKGAALVVVGLPLMGILVSYFKVKEFIGPPLYKLELRRQSLRGVDWDKCPRCGQVERHYLLWKEHCIGCTVRVESQALQTEEVKDMRSRDVNGG